MVSINMPFMNEKFSELTRCIRESLRALSAGRCINSINQGVDLVERLNNVMRARMIR
jgi:hypothetical protein